MLEHINLFEFNQTALTYLLDDNIDDIVLVGGPGEGKSTITQYVSQIYRAQLTNKFNEIFKHQEKNILRKSVKYVLEYLFV